MWCKYKYQGHTRALSKEQYQQPETNHISNNNNKNSGLYYYNFFLLLSFVNISHWMRLLAAVVVRLMCLAGWQCPAPSAEQDQRPCRNTTWTNSGVYRQNFRSQHLYVDSMQWPRGCCSWHTFHLLNITNNLDWHRRPRQKSTPVFEWGGPRGCCSRHTFHLLNITNNLDRQR